MIIIEVFKNIYFFCLSEKRKKTYGTYLIDCLIRFIMKYLTHFNKGSANPFRTLPSLLNNFVNRNLKLFSKTNVSLLSLKINSIGMHVSNTANYTGSITHKWKWTFKCALKRAIMR